MCTCGSRVYYIYRGNEYTYIQFYVGYARVQPGYTLQLQLDDFFLEEESGAPPEEPAIGIRPTVHRRCLISALITLMSALIWFIQLLTIVEHL